MKTNYANFYFRSLCIKLVALCMNLYQEAALSFKNFGDPALNPNLNLCLSTFQLKVNQCYQIFHWSWNFWEMLSLISFLKTYLARSAGDGKSYSSQ